MLGALHAFGMFECIALAVFGGCRCLCSLPTNKFSAEPPHVNSFVPFLRALPLLANANIFVP